jgi:hypothetical protein
MRLPSGAHLTYCTNIHRGESWGEVHAALAKYLPPIAARLAPGEPFAVGLRLSALAAAELEASERALDQLLAILSEVKGYVPTINGFPYGEFHRGAVKEGVYLPDWHEAERVAYTLRLARIAAKLAARLPGSPRDPSISTVPGCFRPALRPGSLELLGRRLRETALGLARLEEETGVRVTLGLEPEPACLLETTEEGVRFLADHVYGGSTLAADASTFGLSPSIAGEQARRHLGLCLDACHAAVGFESSTEVVRLLREEDVLVTKLQVTSALALESATPHLLQELARFDDGIYLHQVSVRTPAGVRRFVDLSEALADKTLLGQPWRVHFHVPVSESRLGELGTTRPFLEEVLAAQRERPFTNQLEVETYTFDVLPSALRGDPAQEIICQELEWTRAQLRE